MDLRVLTSLIISGCGFAPGAATDSGTGSGGDAPASVPDAAPDGNSPFTPACMTNSAYTVRPTTTHRFRLMSASADYDTGVEACEKDGAHLAQISDASENTYVHATYFQDFWLGLNDLTTEGTFHWTDRELTPYRDFNGNEPNNALNNEDCVYMDFTGLWNDTACDNNRKALCECEPDYHAPAVPACRSMAGAKTTHGRKYFVLDTMSWAEASQACIGMGGYLMVPSDDNENALIESGGDINANADAWLGLIQDPGDPTKWGWSNGSPYLYDKWDGPKPTPAAGFCGKIEKNNSQWQSVDCTTTIRGVCECDPGTP